MLNFFARFSVATTTVEVIDAEDHKLRDNDGEHGRSPSPPRAVHYPDIDFETKDPTKVCLTKHNFDITARQELKHKQICPQVCQMFQLNNSTNSTPVDFEAESHGKPVRIPSTFMPSSPRSLKRAQPPKGFVISTHLYSTDAYLSSSR